MVKAADSMRPAASRRPPDGESGGNGNGMRWPRQAERVVIGTREARAWWIDDYYHERPDDQNKWVTEKICHPGKTRSAAREPP